MSRLRRKRVASITFSCAVSPLSSDVLKMVRVIHVEGIVTR